MIEPQVDMKRLGMVRNQPVFKAHEVYLGADHIHFYRVNFLQTPDVEGKRMSYELVFSLQRPIPN
jgi:hypothetical protein